MRPHELNLLEQLYAEFRTAVRAGVGLECDVFKQKVVEYHHKMNEALLQIEVARRGISEKNATTYEVGLYNGLEYAMRIIENRCVDYRDTPDVQPGFAPYLPDCTNIACDCRHLDASEVTETAP